MDSFLERFFQASRARWWQVLAAICIGALFGFMGAWDHGPSTAFAAGVKHAAPYAVGGGALGLLAALFLLWVDATRRARDARLTCVERILIACLILGFALGAFSLLCGLLMGIIKTIDYLSRL